MSGFWKRGLSRGRRILLTGTDSGKDSRESILNISVEGKLVAGVERGHLPFEERWTMKIDGPAAIQFVDSAGTTHDHEIPSPTGWLHLEVFISIDLTCQASAIASSRKIRAPDERIGDDEIAMRIQPFFLAGADAVPDLAGEGLFARGLHFGGTITPSNMLLSCRCDACGQSFLGQSNHTGWLDQTYFYSESGRFTLITDIRVGVAERGNTEPDYASMEALVKALPSAPDGSKFSYSNPFRCPYCAAAYIDFQKHPDLHDREYYLLRHIDTPLLRFP
jgi:hypothetical protein